MFIRGLKILLPLLKLNYFIYFCLFIRDYSSHSCFKNFFYHEFSRINSNLNHIFFLNQISFYLNIFFMYSCPFVFIRGLKILLPLLKLNYFIYFCLFIRDYSFYSWFKNFFYHESSRINSNLNHIFFLIKFYFIKIFFLCIRVYLCSFVV